MVLVCTFPNCTGVICPGRINIAMVSDTLEVEGLHIKLSATIKSWEGARTRKPLLDEYNRNQWPTKQFAVHSFGTDRATHALEYIQNVFLDILCYVTASC